MTSRASRTVSHVDTRRWTRSPNEPAVANSVPTTAAATSTSPPASNAPRRPERAPVIPQDRGADENRERQEHQHLEAHAQEREHGGRADEPRQRQRPPVQRNIGNTSGTASATGELSTSHEPYEVMETASVVTTSTSVQRGSSGRSSSAKPASADSIPTSGSVVASEEERVEARKPRQRRAGERRPDLGIGEAMPGGREVRERKERVPRGRDPPRVERDVTAGPRVVGPAGPVVVGAERESEADRRGRAPRERAGDSRAQANTPRRAVSARAHASEKKRHDPEPGRGQDERGGDEHEREPEGIREDGTEPRRPREPEPAPPDERRERDAEHEVEDERGEQLRGQTPLRRRRRPT